MKLTLILLSFSIVLNAYDGCGLTKEEALLDLSGKIRTTVHNEITMQVSSETTKDSSEESIEQKVDSFSKNSTHLSLVKINYTKKGNQHCASVNKKDQVDNTNELFKIALTFDEKNLPKNIDEKIKKLSTTLSKLDELSYLVPEFYEPKKGEMAKDKAVQTISKKTKTFQDIYDDTIAYSDSLIFKSCNSSKEDAFAGLNKQLFENKTKKTDDEGIFGKTTSFFTSIFSSSKDEAPMLELFSTKVTYAKKDSKECAIIKKSDLLSVATSLNTDVKRFDKNSLSKKPIDKYKEILNYQEQLNVTKAVIELFPSQFDKNDFKKITSVKQFLADELKTTHPQYVKFSVSGAKDIKIKVDDKEVKANEEIYLKKGEHTYTITASEKCPITDTFSLDLLDKEEISKDFTDMNYPTVLFATDKSVNIILNGHAVKANVAVDIKQCQGSVRYLVKASGQNKDGEINLKPNTKETIDLKFLTAQELAIFTDAKVKNYTVSSNVKFSESLTSVVSKSFEFSVDSKPEHGELTIHENGNFSYKSEEGFIGMDSFEYIVKANGEDSAPKIVNIVVKASAIPVVAVVAPKDVNTTKEETKPKVEEVEEVSDKAKEEAEELRYQKFKAYVNSQEQNIEKLKKLQNKYPKLFDRLLKEKMGM